MPELPILTYHRVGDPTHGPPGITIPVSEFTWQADLLVKTGFTSYNLEAFIKTLHGTKESRGRTLLITFDDGYEEFYSVAWPILKERKLSATVFITTGVIGGVNSWDTSGGSLKILAKEQIVELSSDGLDFGAHTHSHPQLPELSEEDALREIRESKAVLEELLGQSVRAFCYPYGRSTPMLKRIIASEGFACAFASDTGPQDFKEDPFEIRRIGIFPGLTRAGFLRKISGYYHRYRMLTGR